MIQDSPWLNYAICFLSGIWTYISVPLTKPNFAKKIPGMRRIRKNFTADIYTKYFLKKYACLTQCSSCPLYIFVHCTFCSPFLHLSPLSTLIIPFTFNATDMVTDGGIKEYTELDQTIAEDSRMLFMSCRNPASVPGCCRFGVACRAVPAGDSGHRQ